MRILGLDPGSRYTGWGLIEQRHADLHTVDFGRIRCTGAALADRLGQLVAEVDRLLTSCRPAAVAIEAVYHGVNTRSLITLAQARGALLGAVGARSQPVAEYAPAEIKSAVTGNGRATKDQVQRMVRMILRLADRELSADAADALAAAICHARRARLAELASR